LRRQVHVKTKNHLLLLQKVDLRYPELHIFLININLAENVVDSDRVDYVY